MGYVQKIYFYDALTVEIWTMLHGMKLPWKKRIPNLVVESDSKTLINMVS